MISKLYAIKDTVSNMFHPPFCSVNAQEAIRAFQIRLKQPQQLMSMYPNNFSLYYVGEFDDIEGSVKQGEITHIINGDDLVKDPENVESNENG